MANFKGNPDLKKYEFTTEREEPCIHLVNLKMPLSLKNKLKAKENWQEFVRQTLAKALAENVSDN